MVVSDLMFRSTFGRYNRCAFIVFYSLRWLSIHHLFATSTFVESSVGGVRMWCCSTVMEFSEAVGSTSWKEYEGKDLVMCFNVILFYVEAVSRASPRVPNILFLKYENLKRY